MGKKSMEKKLYDAMEEDEANIQNVVERLTSIANRKYVIVIKDPANPQNDVPVRARALKDVEVSAYIKKLRAINPLLMKSDFDESKITAEQQDATRDLMDEYIELATSISRKDLKQIGNDKIRATIFAQIMKISTPSEGEIENLKKFRDSS